MKQSASQEPITHLTKPEVEEKRLGEFVVMPSGCDEAFSTWCKASGDVVNVRYPHEWHGVAGKVSNPAKTDTMQDFLDFVDTNIQLNQMDTLLTPIALLTIFYLNSQPYNHQKLPFKTMSNASQHP